MADPDTLRANKMELRCRELEREKANLASRLAAAEVMVEDARKLADAWENGTVRGDAISAIAQRILAHALPGQAYECERCGCTEPEEVTGGWRCSKCRFVPPECSCYETTGGHQPGCILASRPSEPASKEAAKLEAAEAALQEANARLRVASESNDLACSKLEAAEAERHTLEQRCNNQRRQLSGLEARLEEHRSESRAQDQLATELRAKLEAAEAERAHLLAWLHECREKATGFGKLSEPLDAVIEYVRGRYRNMPVAAATEEPKPASEQSPAVKRAHELADAYQCGWSAAMARVTEEQDAPDAPPGFREIKAFSDSRGTLSLGLGGFTTIRACHRCGALIVGGPTVCVHCAAAAPENPQPQPHPQGARLGGPAEALRVRLVEALQSARYEDFHGHALLDLDKLIGLLGPSAGEVVK